MPKPSSFRRRSDFSPFSGTIRRVPGIGPQPCTCMLIGERPGIEEATHRPNPEPFVGPSGRILNLCLGAAAVARSSIYITNLVKSYRDYQKPTAEDIAADHDELAHEILACDPRIIGLVGGYAVTGVLGLDKAEMDKRHGVPILVTELFGGELTWSSLTSSHTDTQDGWLVMPILHPAGAVHSPDSLALILDDFLELGRLIDGEIGPVMDEIGDDTDYREILADDLGEILPW